MRWNAEIHYHDGSVAPFDFEDWDDFQRWLLVGPDHDWTTVVNIVIVPVFT